MTENKKDPKAKVRNRPSPVFDATHPKVNDDKDHFPLGTEAQARNALARANQFKSKPSWWNGSLEQLVSAVAKAVHKKYPGIEIDKETKKPGKKKASDIINQFVMLKIASPEVYVGAVSILRSKIASGETHEGFNTEELKVILKEIE